MTSQPVEAVVRPSPLTISVDTSRIEHVLRIIGKHATACADDLEAARTKADAT